MEPLVLHEYARSGNCYKIRLTAAHVGARLERREYDHEPNVATLRFWFGWIGEANFSEFQRAALPLKRAAGIEALQLMDDHLTAHEFLVAGRFGIADIVLYAYTHTCEEGGYRLADYPAVAAWLRRVEAQPGHVPLED